MEDIDRAKALLENPNTTCVLCKGEITYMSESTGISPMLDFLEKGIEMTGFSAADRIVGKAAALLFARAGIATVYGEVMSRAAIPVLRSFGIRYSFGTLCEYIVNRSQDAMCPMEQTVTAIDEPLQAEQALREKRALLRAQKQKKAEN